MTDPTIYLEIRALEKAGLTDSQIALELGLHTNVLKRLREEMKEQAGEGSG